MLPLKSPQSVGSLCLRCGGYRWECCRKSSEMGLGQVNVAADTFVDLEFPVDPKSRLVD